MLQLTINYVSFAQNQLIDAIVIYTFYKHIK